MPRHVDPDDRRRDIAEATWRVIRSEGLEHASVRSVAAEAGLSMGSLRHYFTTQTELQTYAMQLVSDRVAGRLGTATATGSLRERIEHAVAALLPLDEQRRAESEVWLAYTARTLVDPELRALRDELHDGLQELYRVSIEALISAGLAPDTLDVPLETARLAMLVDGISLNAVARPQHTPVPRMVATVRRHLDSLCTGAGPTEPDQPA